MVDRLVHNLEFPPYVTEFTVGDYTFKRIPDYSTAFGELQHLVSVVGSEHLTSVQTGALQVTAIVEVPDQERPAVLPWADKEARQLLDVMLLLTLFSNRNVFLKNWESDENTAILHDHRIHYWGGQLSLSLKHESMWKHRRTGVLTSPGTIEESPAFNHDPVNVRFERGLNAVLDLISSKTWLEKYSGGYFLFLFRQAVQPQIIETTFILCWAIWEHVFTLHNRKWLDKRTIETLSGYEKIAFIVNEYFLVSIDETARGALRSLAKTRNRIVHFGKIPDGADHTQMVMLIRLTEQLMAVILGLRPSNAFNSVDGLKEFLKQEAMATVGEDRQE